MNFPPFKPHLLFRGGHAQTLAGAYLPSERCGYRAQPHRVQLADGDQLILHDNCPTDWRPTDRSAVLIHGLGGSHQSGYMRRTAQKLVARGVRAFRLDLRGCGAGVALARLPYHSGRSQDAADVLKYLARHLPDSPVTLVGFSLGGNIALKLLGELGQERCGRLDSALAVCPPADLAACARQISRAANRPYDRYFVRHLLRQLNENRRQRPDAPPLPLKRPPRTLWEFDDTITAALCGFGTAENYYRLASSASVIPAIRWPTLIVAADDDPLVPSGPLRQIELPPAVRFFWSSSGGHLGFVGRRGVDPDRRWIDWRVVDWVLAQNGIRPTDAAPQNSQASQTVAK